MLRPIKFLLLNVVFDVVRFPVWWYTGGVAWIARGIAESLEGLIQGLSLRILFKNLFVPMYGDYTKSGRFISFGVRLVQMVVYLCVTFVWILILGVGFFLWILFPLIIAYSIYYQIASPDEHLLITLWNDLKQ